MAHNGKIRRAPGFADRSGRDFEVLDSAVRTVREVLRTRGYQPIETPLIEQTELFLRRSGGLLSSQMFDFTAPDGSDISLRPELTAPVIRFALEQPTSVRPLRYQYASPIFRYNERPFDAPPNSVPSNRQYVQAGAELIGASQPAADGEIIATAYDLAHQLGVERVVVRIGHVGLIWEMLQKFNLSERAKLFLANNVSEFADDEDGGAKVEEEAARLGLMPSPGQQNVETQASAAELLTRLASGSVQLPSATEHTSRTAEDVVGGLRRKLESDVSNGDFTKAMGLMRALANLRSGHVDRSDESDGDLTGDADARHDSVIDRVSELARQAGLDQLNSLRNLSRVKDAILSAGVHGSDVSLDLGVATSIAYYSGTIFEISASVSNDLVPIGGGGRYDGLAASLGSDGKLPALGFALDLDTVLELVDGVAENATNRRYIVLVPADASAESAVLRAASDLRGQGHSVFSLFTPGSNAQSVAESLGEAEVATVSCEDDGDSYELAFE